MWDKSPFGVREGFIQSHFEMAWSNLLSRTQKFAWEWNGSSRHGEEFLHPTQKPVELMMWCINLVGQEYAILDPFLGSGTTAVAAKKLGRHFLGMEISETYCQIARERIALVEAQPSLFERKPEQLVFA
jgi:DNA modification methylase